MEDRTQIEMPDGRVALVRPLTTTDVEPLTAFFLGLSPQTRRMYGPHPFDRATAERLCASADDPSTIRFIAVLEDASQAPQIIGYMILARELSPNDVERYGEAIRVGECAAFAPAMSDAYQDRGIGTQMARHVLACARRMGLRQVILMGGVRAANHRAQHFYRKLGFAQVGEFWSGREGERLLNYDMALELDPGAQHELF